MYMETLSDSSFKWNTEGGQNWEVFSLRSSSTHLVGALPCCYQETEHTAGESEACSIWKESLRCCECLMQESCCIKTWTTHKSLTVSRHWFLWDFLCPRRRSAPFVGRCWRFCPQPKSASENLSSATNPLAHPQPSLEWNGPHSWVNEFCESTKKNYIFVAVASYLLDFYLAWL